MNEEDGTGGGKEGETSSRARENTRRDNNSSRSATADGVTPSALSIEGLDKDSILNLTIPHSRKRTRQVCFHSCFRVSLGHTRIVGDPIRLALRWEIGPSNVMVHRWECITKENMCRHLHRTMHSSSEHSYAGPLYRYNSEVLWMR